MLIFFFLHLNKLPFQLNFYYFFFLCIHFLYCKFSTPANELYSIIIKVYPLIVPCVTNIPLNLLQMHVASVINRISHFDRLQLLCNYQIFDRGNELQELNCGNLNSIKQGTPVFRNTPLKMFTCMKNFVIELLQSENK